MRRYSHTVTTLIFEDALRLFILLFLFLVPLVIDGFVGGGIETFDFISHKLWMYAYEKGVQGVRQGEIARNTTYIYSVFRDDMNNLHMLGRSLEIPLVADIVSHVCNCMYVGIDKFDEVVIEKRNLHPITKLKQRKTESARYFSETYIHGHYSYIFETAGLGELAYVRIENYM